MYSVKITSEDGSKKKFEGDCQVEVFVDVVDYLMLNHPLEDKIGLPYGPSNKRAILNTKPQNIDGSDMNSFRVLSNGLYINTNLNRKQKIKYILQLVSMCELDVYYEGWG